MEDKKVYILLTDTGTLFTKMIKFYTKKPYNHASISLDPSFKKVYSFGRKNTHNPFIGGFVIENLQAELFTHARCAIYCCTVTGDQMKIMYDYIERIEAHKDHYRYNLLGLFALALNKQLKRENAFFCSQFVAAVLQKANVIAFPKALSLITPHDLEVSPTLQLVYQGKLEDYLCGSTIEQNETMVDPLLA